VRFTAAVPIKASHSSGGGYIVAPAGGVNGGLGEEGCNRPAEAFCMRAHM
jgi:hypothetical protein